MPDVETWAKLAAYIICMGVVLELAHKFYWQIYRRVVALPGNESVRAVFSTICALIPLIAVLGVTGVFCVYIDHQPIISLGLQHTMYSLPLFVSGVVIAFVVVSLLFIVGCSARWFRLEKGVLAEKQGIPAFCGGVSDFLTAAVFEEIISRGYIFSVMQHQWGGFAAVMGSAILFSLFHLAKHPKIPFIFILNGFLFGIVTGQARLVTGMLWAPIGLHFGWNLAMGPVFGLPCSGRRYDAGLVCCAVGGPEWLTGGLYSPDAGVIGTAALIVASIALATFMPV